MAKTVKLIRLNARDNLSVWAEKTNSIINVVEEFIATSGSIVTQGTPNTSQIVVWDNNYTNKTLTGPITLGAQTATTVSFSVNNEIITDLTEKTIASSNDYVMIFDSTGNALKKAKISSIQTSQAAAGSNTQVQYNQNGVFGASSGLTFNYTTNVLNIAGGLTVAPNKLVVDPNSNNVGIGQLNPSYKLDVWGDVNVAGGFYRINGAVVLTSTSLGSSVVSSNLQSVGTLTSLTVSGTANIQGQTTISNTLFVNNINSTGTISGTSLSATGTVSGNSITASTATFSSNLSVKVSGNFIDVGGAYIEPTNFQIYATASNTLPAQCSNVSFLRKKNTGVVANDFLGRVLFYGYGTTTVGESAAIVCAADGTFSDSAFPGKISFYTTQTTSNIERMTIFSDGNVSIGTTSKRSLLYVAGTINADNTTISSSTVAININGSGDRQASITFHTNTTYDPALRIFRDAGANGQTIFTHRGTGHLIFVREESGFFLFRFGTNNLLSLDTAGQFYVGSATYSVSSTFYGDVLVRDNYITSSRISISNSGSGDRNSILDFFSESGTYTLYDSRIIREAGANGVLNIFNRGTGGILISNIENGSIYLSTAGNNRVIIDGTGVTTVYGELKVI
jgi:hypothetical protein